MIWIVIICCWTAWCIVDRALSNKERLMELEVERAANAHDVMRGRS